MTVSILATTDNGDPAFGLKQGTLARKPNLDRAVRGARQVTCLLLGAFTGARLLWKP